MPSSRATPRGSPSIASPRPTLPARHLLEADAARRGGGRSLRRGHGGRPVPRLHPSSSRRRHPRDVSGARSSRSCGPTSRSSRPASTGAPWPTGTSTSSTPCARATRTRWRGPSRSTSRPPRARSRNAGPSDGMVTRSPVGASRRRSPARHSSAPGRRESWIQTCAQRRVHVRPGALAHRRPGRRPRDHVLDDLSFLDYRLADVRVPPRSRSPSRTSSGTGGREGCPHVDGVVTFTRRVACGPPPEGHRRRPRPAHGGRRPPPSPQRGRPLPRTDSSSSEASLTTARAWVSSRPVAAARSRWLADDGHRRGRARGDGLGGRLPRERTEGTERSDKAPRPGRAPVWVRCRTWGMFEGQSPTSTW